MGPAAAARPPGPCHANAPLYPADCTPSAPTVPAGAPGLRGPSPLSNAHQGSPLRWENTNSYTKHKKNSSRGSGRSLVAAPGSSGQIRPKGTRTKPRSGLCTRATHGEPRGALRAPPGRLTAPSPLPQGGTAIAGPAAPRSGEWGPPYRPDSVCALLSTTAEGPLPLAITSLRRNFPPSSTQTLTPSSPPAQSAPLPLPALLAPPLPSEPRGGKPSASEDSAALVSRLLIFLYPLLPPSPHKPNPGSRRCCADLGRPPAGAPGPHRVPPLQVGNWPQALGHQPNQLGHE